MQLGLEPRKYNTRDRMKLGNEKKKNQKMDAVSVIVNVVSFTRSKKIAFGSLSTRNKTGWVKLTFGKGHINS